MAASVIGMPPDAYIRFSGYSVVSWLPFLLTSKIPRDAR